MDSKISIYIATHSEHITEDEMHVPIQVGAAGSEQDIQAVKDNTGDNISDKNGSYCELTALYWVWKNDKSDIVGLEHYRRRFRLKADEIYKTLENKKYIVSKPYKYRLSLTNEYKEAHVEDDFELMIEAIEAVHIGEGRKARKFFWDTNELVPFNMMIAKKEDMDAYCQWLFPVLKYIEEHAEAHDDTYQSRYIGFLSERLMTFYVHKNLEQVEFVKIQDKKAPIHKVIKNAINQQITNPLVFKLRSRKV